MATATAKARESRAIGKWRDPSSNSHTSTFTGTKKSAKPSTRSSSSDQKGTTRSTLTEKQIPNYLKPTISSRLESYSSSNKVLKNDTAPQKPNLNRRRPIERSASSPSTLPNRKEPSKSRLHKAPVSPASPQKRLPLLRSSSTRAPLKSTVSSKPIPDRILKTRKHAKPHPILPAKNVNAKKSSKITAAPTSKEEADASADLTKAPESADTTTEKSTVVTVPQDTNQEVEVLKVEDDEDHEVENVSEIPPRVNGTEDKHEQHHEVEESDQPHIQADNESDQPHIQADNESDQPHIQADNESDQPHIQAVTDSDQAHIQADDGSDQPHIQADYKSDQSHVQADYESDQPHIQAVTDSDQPYIQADDGSDQPHIPVDNESDQPYIQADDERVFLRESEEEAIPVTKVEEKGELQEDKTKDEQGEEESSIKGQSNIGSPPEEEHSATEGEVKVKEKEEECGLIEEHMSENNNEERTLEEKEEDERELIEDHEHILGSEVEEAKTETKLKQQAGKGSQAYNDVIEETASKLLETRKNKVKALAGAFQTVIDYQTSSK